MDRDFMCSFYRNILPTRAEVALQDNIPYRKVEERLKEMEDELHTRMDDATWNFYLKMSDLQGKQSECSAKLSIYRAQRTGSRCSDRKKR